MRIASIGEKVIIKMPSSNFLQQLTGSPGLFVIATLNLNGDTSVMLWQRKVGGIGIAPVSNINISRHAGLKPHRHGTTLCHTNT